MKPSTSDPFGYDGSGRPVAVKLTSNVYAFGDKFCSVLQAQMEHGCRPATRILADGKGMIFIFHPATRRAEVWAAPWKEDDPGIYSILNPDHRGIVAGTFYDFDTLRSFASGDLKNLTLKPGRLSVLQPSG